MKKLKSFLLVDDSDSTNFFNKAILQKIGCVEEIMQAKNGKEALAYLTSGTVPEVIFLDINMPVMDGWEFLEEFVKLDDTIKSNTIIILMIGAELSVMDKEKTKDIIEIKEFQEKMLTKEVVCEILKKYFKEVNPEVCQQLERIAV